MDYRYDHILIRYGELSLKGKNRNVYIRQLRENIKKALKSVRSSMKEENFNSFLRDMVSHHISAILETNPEEDEIEKKRRAGFLTGAKGNAKLA